MKIFLSSLLFLLLGFNSYTLKAQCPFDVCNPEITVTDFPTIIDQRDPYLFITFKFSSLASCTYDPYEAKLEIVKVAGPLGPERVIYTVPNLTFLPGNTLYIGAVVTADLVTEGSIMQGNNRTAGISFRIVDGDCATTGLSDATTEYYEFYLKNCEPSPQITADGLTLTSSQSGDVSWYYNNNLLPGEESEVLNANADGDYILEVYENGCYSFDTLHYEGLNYLGNGELEAPEVEEAVYAWYKDNALIEDALTRFYTATQNGTYKVEVNYCDNCRKAARTEAGSVATFYKTVSDLSVTAVESGSSSTNLYLYPNPAQDVIRLKESKLFKSLRIIDMNGNFRLQSDQLSVDVSSLGNGIYVVEVTEEQNGVSFLRLVKTAE